MGRKRDKDEHLERLWYMKEDGVDSIDELKAKVKDKFSVELLMELASGGLVDMPVDGQKAALTKKGEDAARQLIRAHRLAERMLHDVLGGEFETGACEFEHTVAPELVDSICILLGHPRECPHGMPIPEGECCKRSAKTVNSSVMQLDELEIGRSARVAYINCRDDRCLHKIDGLQIRPGAVIKLHQTYPTYVIECEGANIAIDKGLASSIAIWRDAGRPVDADTGPSGGKPRSGFGRRRRGERH